MCSVKTAGHHGMLIILMQLPQIKQLKNINQFKMNGIISGITIGRSVSKFVLSFY